MKKIRIKNRLYGLLRPGDVVTPEENDNFYAYARDASGTRYAVPREDWEYADSTESTLSSLRALVGQDVQELIVRFK
jgi:hypothetical protein